MNNAIHQSFCFAFFTLSFTIVLSASPESSGPQPTALPPEIAAPKDIPYPGVIDLSVDITDVQRRIITIHESIPVKPGKLTLLYPKWIPGTHSPTGLLSKVGGLTFRGNGKTIEWVRDPVEVFAFHVDIPSGVKILETDFQFLAPLRTREGRVSISSQIADLAWNTVVLYPAGHFSRQIQLAPTIKLPPSWQFASSLEVASQQANTVHFKATPLNKLVDSPLYAGKNFKRVDLSTAPGNQVFLDVFSDTSANLAITDKQIDMHKRMVVQAEKLFRSRHYDRYDFLFLLSDTVGGIGLEHHQSSEDGTKANYFTDWNAGISGRDLLAHEYTHSWNGKFRRSADLWTPNFNVPMRDDLLWVYEGMTQYYGYVLTARSGLRTVDQTRDLIAQVAENFDRSPGRKWRPLVDTTNQPTISQRTPVSWVSWQRPEDYYTEGMLIWLDADTKIRELSNEKKSLDDFARLFFGVDNGSYITRTYTFQDVVSALNTVQPFDWATFLKTRVDHIAPQPPKDGLTRGGYRLAFNDAEAAWRKHEEQPDRAVNFSTSLGLSVKANGDVENVWWESPSFKAGLTPDMHLTAVNGAAFSIAKLRSAIAEAKNNKEPIKLLLKRGDQFQTFDIDYHDGLRYPNLQRVDGTPDRLGAILSPLN